jgi:hypothetical protein
MRTALLILLTLTVLLPGATAEDPDPRPLCDGEPLVELRECYGGYELRTCGSDDRLMGAGCFAL